MFILCWYFEGQQRARDRHKYKRMLLKSFPTVPITLLFLLAAFTGCEREEGFGGKSSVSGHIITREFNRDMSLMLQEYPAAGQDVYIIFGNETISGDDQETAPDGSFSFRYLTPGDYEVYYYCDDTTMAGGSGDMTLSYPISLARNEDFDLGTLYAYDLKDYNDGHAQIRGRVMVINYKATAFPPYSDEDIKDIVPAQDYEVYLIYGDHGGYDERERTDYAGYFRFDKLIIGNYRVYTFTDEISGGRYDMNSEQIIYYPQSNGSYKPALYRDTVISQATQVVNVEDFYTEKD